MVGEIKNSTYVWLSVVASFCYCYLFSLKLSKGILRFVSLLPVLYFFTILPLYLSSCFLRAVAAWLFTWLTCFKLLLIAFNQGPLSLDQSKSSLPNFITSAALPIRMKQNVNQPPSSQPCKTTKMLPLNIGTEILAFAAFIGLTGNCRENLHPKLVLVLYCCRIFLLVDVLVALSSFVVRALVGLELKPPSDEPYLSTSLQEFWGGRWNLTVTNSLRETVYKPVRSVCTIVLGKDWAPLPAAFSAFLVSGLMHELLFDCVTLAKPSWEMTLFFILQGVCVVLEIGFNMALKGSKWQLPWFVSGPLTVGFVVITNFRLCFSATG